MLTNRPRGGDTSRVPGTRVDLPARIGTDACVMAGFVLLAVFLYRGLWFDLDRGYLAAGGPDQNLWEWFFAVTADAVRHGHNPLFSALQNHPGGVNLMANTVMLGAGIPLVPVTLVFGPTATWAIVLTGGLAGTAAAWYWTFSRNLVRHRLGAAIGGAFCGFAPAMISHGNGHPNFVAWFLLPIIAVKVVRLARGERPVRSGVHLGLLTAYQIFLGEEPLLIFAIAFGIFTAVHVFMDRDALPPKPHWRGIGIGTAVTLAIVAFPLWWQFFGPQSYRALDHGQVGNDLTAFARFPTQSLLGGAAEGAMSRTEENAFFGWPLLVLLLVIAVWLWRRALARSLAITFVVMALLSLGTEIVVDGHDTGVPGPWLLLAHLPVFDSVLESRLAMACIPIIGALLALATDRAVTARKPLLAWSSLLVAALLPIAPTSYTVAQRGATPAFFTDGTWRHYGGTVVPVPLPSNAASAALHWQVDAGLGFSMPEGYFVGPVGPGDRHGRYGATPRPTSVLLDEVSRTGTVPPITAGQRSQAVGDLRYWDAGVVVLVPLRAAEPLRLAVSELLGSPGEFVGGVWVWDVRHLSGGTDGP